MWLLRQVAAVLDDLPWLLFDYEACGARREMNGFGGVDQMMGSTETLSARVVQHQKRAEILKASNDVMSHKITMYFLTHVRSLSYTLEYILHISYIRLSGDFATSSPCSPCSPAFIAQFEPQTPFAVPNACDRV